MKRSTVLFAAALLFAAPSTSRADDQAARPSEDAMFGGDQKPADAKPADAAPEQKPEQKKDGAAPQRPSEADLFGGSATEASQRTAPTTAPTPVSPDGAASRQSEADLFGAASNTNAGGDARSTSWNASTDNVPEDPLKIGGQLYLRSQVAARENAPPAQWTLAAPALVDGYFDARPNDRVRGFVLARMRYDPTIDPNVQTSNLSQSLVFKADPGPSVLLDQLWLRFDLGHTVFVTAGKQHVKWGTARFWNPTDYLHNQKRDALAVFDPRVGTTMLKLHLPWEKRGWNFYAMGLLDNPTPAGELAKIGAAARAEVVFGTAELGLDGVALKGSLPKLGADLSMGVGDFDVYGELSLRSGKDSTLWREATLHTPAGDFKGFETYSPAGLTVQATGGLNYSFRYNDNDVFTLGGEYFYNQLGYADATIYPWLIFQNAFTPFYLGRQYASVYAVLAAPWSLDTSTFALSNIANLSDKSVITRLDYTLILLTHLRFEAFGDVHYGGKGGEFHFGLDIPSQVVNGQTTPAVSVPAPTFDLGVGLRVSI